MEKRKKYAAMIVKKTRPAENSTWENVLESGPDNCKDVTRAEEMLYELTQFGRANVLVFTMYSSKFYFGSIN